MKTVQLHANDIIKLGRIKLRVRDIYPESHTNLKNYNETIENEDDDHGHISNFAIPER